MQIRRSARVALVSLLVMAATTAAGSALAQGVQGDLNARLGPPVPQQQPQQQSPQQGLTCPQAQQRYVQVINGLNSARARGAAAEADQWNRSRVNLEQYMTYRLRGCAIPVVTAPTRAFQETGRTMQPERRDAAGRIVVEAAVIHGVNCQGGGSIYVFEYLNRRGFRAIQPPNWGRALGGGDFANFADAASMGCGAIGGR